MTKTKSLVYSTRPELIWVPQRVSFVICLYENKPVGIYFRVKFLLLIQNWDRNSPEVKIVRVVTTVQYLLTD